VLVYKVGDMETFRPSLAAKRCRYVWTNVTGFAWPGFVFAADLVRRAMEESKQRQEKEEI
jgi:hypothetical protein